MESEHNPNKDGLPTFTATQRISTESELTHGNMKPDDDYGDTFDGDPSVISNDSDMGKASGEDTQCDVQDAICDNKSLQRTIRHSKCEKENENVYRKTCYILDSSRKCHSDSEESGITLKTQKSSPLFKSKSMINMKINSVKETQNINKGVLTHVSNSSSYQNKGCFDSDNQDNQRYYPNFQSPINKNTASRTLNLYPDLSNSKLNILEKEFSLVQNLDSNIHEASQNINDEASLQQAHSIYSKAINKVSTISGNTVIQNYNTTNTRNAATLPSSKLSPKTVTFDRNQTPPKRPRRSVEIRRLSRTRLSQWGRRNEKPAISIQTSLPIVEGIDEKRLWSEAKVFNQSALLVLWWTLLAIVMYILSFYDLWSDCSVAYMFFLKNKYPEIRWCIISIIVLSNSYFLQCCFSYYEVTHALHNHYGPLSKRKYAIPLFFFMPWIIVFIGIYDTYKNKYTRRLESAYIMMFIEVIFESLAQTSLQLNAICVYAHDPIETVSVLQWCSASSSILFLSMGISYSVIFYNNKDATQWIKFLFCVFGGITIVSRLLLCSSWGLQHEIYWAVPFLAGLFTTSVTWLLLRTFPCFGYKEFLTKYDINNLPMALVTSSSWVTSFVFNCFSPSGIPVSILMVVLAGADFSKKGQLPQFDKTLQIINICLTSFVLLCNMVFSFVPKCQILSRTWIEGEGEDEDDPYHFRFY